MLPQKKPKKAELSVAQKLANRELASARSSVEHSIWRAETLPPLVGAPAEQGFRLL